MSDKKPDWENAASEILSVLIPLLLKVRRENEVSLTDLGGFRSQVVDILRSEAEKKLSEPA